MPTLQEIQPVFPDDFDDALDLRFGESAAICYARMA
jgi:hypothetical protein